jgi:hypothetical protein
VARSGPAMIWSFIRQAAQAGFAVAIEPTAKGTFIVRARPVIVRVDRPATIRFSSGLIVERVSVDDAAANLLQALCGELDLDAEKRRARMADEERREAAE